MHTLHTSWRCPSCGVVRDTAPVAQAFCIEEDCPSCFGAMDRHKPDATNAVLSDEVPEHLRGTARMMRENRGILAIL